MNRRYQMKYLFFLTLLLVIFQNNLAANSLRISAVSKKENIRINQYDPAKIYWATEWNMAMNLYSRLIAFDKEGNLVSDLATKFSWQGNEAHFIIRKNFKTIDGIMLTPKDIAFSLKRLIILAPNTHDDIGSLCGNKKLKSITDECKGIKFTNNKIILKLPKQDPFLFRTLTTAYFSIIPKRAINPKTLLIKDYRNTSGLYYFSGYNKSNHIILKANPNHWLYAKNIPHKVEIVPDVYNFRKDGELISDKLVKGKLDVISRMNRAQLPKLHSLHKKFAKKKIEHDFQFTDPIRLRYLCYTPRGFALKPEIRLAILQDTRRLLLQNPDLLSKNFYEQADYIFPLNSHGGLDPKTNKYYKKILSQPIDPKIPKMTIDIMVTSKILPIFKQFLQNGHFKYNILAKPTYQKYIGKDPNDTTIPHLTYFNQDIMFEEDIGLLSYSINHTHIFSLKGKMAQKWLVEFRNELDSKKRMSMLRTLHFDSLVNNPSIVPLYMTRDAAFAINGWQLNFPYHTAETLYRYINKTE